MRKLFFALATMAFMAGLVVAAEVTVVKYDKDKGEVTVKEGEKEKTYKIDDKVKVTAVGKDKDGKETKTDVKFEDFVKYIESKGGKDKDQPRKMDITVKDGTITEVTYTRGGKGGK